jgi:hypothetical protein
MSEIQLSSQFLAEEPLENVRAIGAFTGITPRRLFYLAETGQLPLFKIGNRCSPQLVAQPFRVSKPTVRAYRTPERITPAFARLVDASRHSWGETATPGTRSRR